MDLSVYASVCTSDPAGADTEGIKGLTPNPLPINDVLNIKDALNPCV